jgi:hypothetical protein
MSGDIILKDAILSEVPCVLFLGQAIEGGSASTSSVLNRLLERKELPASVAWPEVLAKGLTPEDLEWLTERFDRTVPTEAFQSALELPWEAVFTSSIDPSLLRRFETLGRQPEALSSSQHHPRAPRSRARPPIHYLFGRSNDVTDATRPPRTRNDLARRLAQHASVLLSRVVETVTPAGLLVIDSYQPGRDWLPSDALIGALPSDGSVRVLWLGIDEIPAGSSLFAELQQSGFAWSDARPLAVLASEIRASGALPSGAVPIFHEPGIVSLERDAFLEVKPPLRLRVEASAAVVDDDWTAPPAAIGRDAEEDLFRLSHGNPGSARSLMEGVSRGFFITRHFEGDLFARTSSLISKQRLDDRVLVLHGQSGTGKSVAVARLALLARTQLHAPVLFGSSRVPEAADVEAFCEEVDRSGHGPTIVIADSNAPPERYFVLSGALRSRGRRHLIVGTSYRLEHSGSAYLLEAPEIVTAAERRQVSELLARFVPSDQITPDVLNGEHVLALLYRAISAGRARIASGLGNEARFVESAIRQRAQSTPRPFTSTLAEQLIVAGLAKPDEALFEPSNAEAPDRDAAGRLIDYVMVAGRVDVAVPVNLLLRALRARIDHLDYHQIGAMFGGLDLFRWRYGGFERTELLVAARLRLEAELICRRRVGGSDRELECLIDLIEAVRPHGIDHNSELQFLLDLLQRLDRDGPREKAYSAGYLRIGRALTTLRKQHAVDDASLMLQESNFRRQWLWFHRTDDAVAPELRDTVLDESREAVEEAIARVEARSLKAGRRTRENLYVERASIYGFLAVGHAIDKTEPTLIWADYLAARVAAQRAMGVAPSYFPFDVGLWTPADLLEEAGDALTPAQRSELVADIYSTLDRVDSQELPPSQREKFNVRRIKLGGLLEDAKLKEAGLSELETDTPAVAAFLKARALVTDILSTEVATFNNAQRERARQAADYLTSRQAVISGDVRCIRLLLELRWIAETGQRLLREERRAIPHTTKSREAILAIASELLAASGDAVDSPIRYLEAVLSWVLGDLKGAASRWKELSHDTDFDDRRRVIRRLVVTDAFGHPVLFRGRLIGMRTSGHWQVDIDGSPARVDLLERDFRGQVFRLGGEIRDFRVAFNFLGPIADPATRQEDR